MIETEKMETFLTTHHYKATSSFGGSAMHAQRAGCTAGRLLHTVEQGKPKRQQDALVVLGSSFVSAIVWKMYVLILLLTLTLKRIVSLLLK